MRLFMDVKDNEMRQRLEVFRKYEPESEIDMINCGYEKCIPNFSTSCHTRPYYLLHFVVQGEGQFFLNENKYIISAGNLFAIFPDNFVSYLTTNPDNQLIFCWMGLSGNNVCKLLETLGLTLANPVFHLLNIHKAYKTIYEITETLNESRSTSSIYIKSTIYKLLHFIEISRNVADLELKRVDSTNHLAWSIAAYLEYNCTGNINIHEVSNHFNINRTYMWKIFKIHIGLSPKTYLINCRMSRAKSLLQNTDKTIKDIAVSCGIPDICHFYKLFTQYTGKTPRQYLKLLKENI
jgi:AraC family transcriptional regulator, arabinose operon regulatory protein